MSNILQSACSTGVLFGYSALAAALIRRGEYSNLCDAAASGEAASAVIDAGDMALEGLGDTHMGNISYIRMYVYKYIHIFTYVYDYIHIYMFIFIHAAVSVYQHFCTCYHV